MSQRPLSSDLSVTLLTNFLNNQPSFYEEDEKIVFSYSQCMVQTLLHLHTFRAGEAYKFIPSILGILQEIMLIEDK